MLMINYRLLSGRMPFTSDQPFMKGKRGPFVLLR